MAKTAAQAVLDEVIRCALLPALRADGYRRSGHTFRRSHGRCIQVVNVQASQFSSADALKFTVNLGVFFPEVHELAKGFWKFTLSASGPKEYECQLRTRIGSLIPPGEDRWWEVRAGEPFATVAAELGTAFTGCARPWLEAMADFDAARRAAAHFGLPVTAVAFALTAGDREEARALLARVLAGGPPAAAIRAWGQEMGLVDG